MEDLDWDALGLINSEVLDWPIFGSIFSVGRPSDHAGLRFVWAACRIGFRSLRLASDWDVLDHQQRRRKKSGSRVQGKDSASAVENDGFDKTHGAS